MHPPTLQQDIITRELCTLIPLDPILNQGAHTYLRFSFCTFSMAFYEPIAWRLKNNNNWPHHQQRRLRLGWNTLWESKSTFTPPCRIAHLALALWPSTMWTQIWNFLLQYVGEFLSSDSTTSLIVRVHFSSAISSELGSNPILFTSATK